LFELLTSPNCRIERICSTWQASPPDYWYDQEWNEWVILLRGGARLLFEDETVPVFIGFGARS
jgi:cupin 2 domain-containing protein